MSDTPELRHIYQNHHLDTRHWDNFQPRSGDIVISTSYKAGTTLTQTIVTNLLFPNDDMPGSVSSISPWLDMRLSPLDETLATLEAQTHRRCIKTHLALDGLPYFEELKYVVVGRDPRDVFMSLVNHYGGHTVQFYEAINGLPGRVGDPFPENDGDIHTLWKNWISRGWFEWENDGYPYWSHLHHAKTWWEFRHLPNIHLIHYNDLRADLEGQMRVLAAYLEIEVPEERWPSVVHECQFETVKANPEKVLEPMFDVMFKGGSDTFLYKATNGRWKDILSEDELALYRQAMESTLPADCAAWLESGGDYGLETGDS
ncbi:MAG TPA: sulfotransferase [Gammaproteobacteria bacterium]|nr:sulfotransferase domain-containing protein [Gammaproteobacteria bacterium]MDP6731352.1 sulfotransferase domain-containing protein [Gammaproteobacteria bacterium]HAJ76973.1 sulfotransferase [Gammaproteobacteria bacterium]